MQRVRSSGEVEARADVLRRKKVFYANIIFNKTEKKKKLKIHALKAKFQYLFQEIHMSLQPKVILNFKTEYRI